MKNFHVITFLHIQFFFCSFINRLCLIYCAYQFHLSELFHGKSQSNLQSEIYKIYDQMNTIIFTMHQFLLIHYLKNIHKKTHHNGFHASGKDFKTKILGLIPGKNTFLLSWESLNLYNIFTNMYDCTTTIMHKCFACYLGD